MRKMTLIEMVQNISSALETDEVNSITDTTESLQIAEVIKETYYEQFNNINIPEHQGIFALDSYSNVASPNYLKIPSTVSKIHWIKYADYREDGLRIDVTYLSPEDFLTLTLPYTAVSSDVVTTVDPSSGVSYFVRANGPPSYFTIFDDDYLAFDSFDLLYETTMQGGNTICFGSKAPEFLMTDAFVPDIDANLFPLLLAESKSVCFVNLKQVSSSKEEQRARRQRIRMQNDQFKSRKAQSDSWNGRASYARYR